MKKFINVNGKKIAYIDEGIGDVFSIRIAGNFENEDILGSMEFTSKLSGTKVIVVSGKSTIAQPYDGQFTS